MSSNNSLCLAALAAALLPGPLSSPSRAATPCAPTWNDPFSAPGGIDHAEVYTLSAIDLDGPGPRTPLLFAGGSFTKADGYPANHIAAWNSGSWSPVGAGLDDDVHSIALFDDDGDGPHPPMLYAATSDGQAGLQRWNGSVWEKAPGWVSGAAHVLCVFDEDGVAGPKPPSLIVGSLGDFRAGSLKATRIARFRGGTWSTLGKGVAGGPVFSMVVHDDDGNGPHLPALYVGGFFTSAGGAAAGHIAKWDGTKWSRLAGGFPRIGAVYALASFDEDGAGPSPPRLFAAGDFTTAGGAVGDRIARWDGKSWSAVGGPRIPGTAFALTVWKATPVAEGPSLFVGCKFDGDSGEGSGGLLRWNGASWSAPPVGVNRAIYALAGFDPDDSGPSGAYLYCGGAFTTAGAQTALRVARYFNGSWRPAGAGVGGGSSITGFVAHTSLTRRPGVLAMQRVDASVTGFSQPALVVGGMFTSAGNGPAGSIAAWDGAAWRALGAGMDLDVQALALFDDDGPGPRAPALYAAGIFKKADGKPADSIARWNGVGWSPVGESHFLAGAFALTVFDPDGTGPQRESLFVAGGITTSGGRYLSSLAKWDGERWSAITGAPSAVLKALAVFDEDGPGPRAPALYVGGQPLDSKFSGIARWDGAKWSPLKPVLQFQDKSLPLVNCMAVFDDDADGPKLPALYVGGKFHHAGAVACPGVARWNGAEWSGLAEGLSYTSGSPMPTSMGVFDDDGPGARAPSLYVSGQFDAAGRRPSPHMARWNGAEWLSVGDGLSSGAASLVPFEATVGGRRLPALIAGGLFSKIGGVRVEHIAAWVGCRTCPQDLNGDQVVDAADLRLTLQGSDAPDAPDAADIGELLAAWGACP